MTPNRVIGHQGKIPWHISEDFRWFKKVTLGWPLLMGRKTFESLGKPLPGRFTYVLTGDPQLLHKPKTELFQYINGGDLNYCQGPWKDLWICGGSTVYKQFVPLCDEVYVSIILEEYEGDTFMPDFEHLFKNSEIYREHKDFWIVKYSK